MNQAPISVKITRHSASAVLALLPSGILIVRLFGPLTGDALMHFKAHIVAMPEAGLIKAFVVDYSRSAIALSGAQLDAVLKGERAGSAPSMPAALVVSQADAGIFYGHAGRMAGQGVMRLVFTQPGPAIAWAHRQADRKLLPL